MTARELITLAALDVGATAERLVTVAELEAVAKYSRVVGILLDFEGTVNIGDATVTTSTGIRFTANQRWELNLSSKAFDLYAISAGSAIVRRALVVE